MAKIEIAANYISFTVERNGVLIPLEIRGDLTGEDYEIVDGDGNNCLDFLTASEWTEVYSLLAEWQAGQRD